MDHLKNLVAAFAFFSVSMGFAVSEADRQQWQLSRNYAEVQTFMRQVVAQYPQNAQIFTLGVNNQGVAIEGVKLGDGPLPNLVVATHHGNEYGSTEVAKGFLLSVAAQPIQGQTIYVIPVLNTGGFDTRSRRETKNGRTYDANRDYPGPCGTEGPFNLNSTAALAKFIADKGIVMSATLHTYTGAALYPWGISTGDIDTHYTDFFKQLGAAAVRESGYKVGNSTAMLYPADGTFEDYAFWQHGIWSMLFEMGYSHSPSYTAVVDMISKNVPGIRRMMEMSPRVRAERHGFEGKCDRNERGPRRTDE